MGHDQNDFYGVFILVYLWSIVVKEVLYDDPGVFYLSVTLCSKQNSTHVWKREWTDHSLTKNIKVCDCKHLSEITPKKSAHRNYPINMTQNINGMDWDIPYKYIYYYYKFIIYS